MTTSDDWNEFVADMAVAGWTFVHTPAISLDTRVGYFEHNNGAGYIPGGRTFDVKENRMGAKGSASDWRTWHKAGQTPAPF